jgi:hypothetical protein
MSNELEGDRASDCSMVTQVALLWWSHGWSEAPSLSESAGCHTAREGSGPWIIKSSGNF